ncbi:MAG: tRNA (guanosine(37)-N1)-methyltransferase TrmD [Candidatus Uhrbacteria bacterium]|nr:tRNA (guanosine(37)-N1)-methyltransferase TrmD [Candidatus Uhrbacteria bacterium]
MKFHVVTLFPDSIKPYLNDSILGRAQEDKKIAVKYYNPRDFTKDKWRRVDRRPYGGGPGMVLEAESVLKAATKALGKKTKKTKVVFFATDGKQFTNKMAREWVKKYDDIIFLFGRYEGSDARAAKILKAEKISVGPYVLTGGELPAMIVIDAVARQLPGVLGTFESVEEKRVASPDVYTRPEVLNWNGKKYKVPKILLSGNHAKIEQWKSEKLARSATQGASSIPPELQKKKKPSRSKGASWGKS